MATPAAAVAFGSHGDAAGCLIKGDTQHFEYICEAVTQGIMRMNLDTGVPVMFGVLTVNTMLQAEERSGLVQGKPNHGAEWAEAAITQANHKRACNPPGLLQTIKPLHTMRDVAVLGFCTLASAMILKKWLK